MGRLKKSPFLEREEYNISGINLPREDYNLENIAAAPAGLYDHLLKQLRLCVSCQEEYIAGELIISRIDHNGYFRGALEETAKTAGIETEKAKKALALIQTFGPSGSGSAGLEEMSFDSITGQKYGEYPGNSYSR